MRAKPVQKEKNMLLDYIILPIVMALAVVIGWLIAHAAIKSNCGNKRTFDLYSRLCADNQRTTKRNEFQQNLVNKYFIVKNIDIKAKPLMICGLVAVIVGAVLVILYFPTTFLPLLVTGSIIIVAGAIMLELYKYGAHKEPPPDMISHADYEKIVDSAIERMNIKELAMERLGLDEEQCKEIEPIVFRDRVLDNTSLTAVDPETGKIHSSTQSVTLIFFTDEQVFVYKQQFDMCCNRKEEWTSEFFYIDICDLSTYNKTNTYNFESSALEYNELVVSLVATNSEISFCMDGDQARMESIQAMRQKIRERKMHA